MLDLDPNGFVTLDEFKAHTRRDRSMEDGDEVRLVDALNRGVSWMEWRTRRKLRSRVHRPTNALASCTTTADSQTVTGTGFSALTVGDDVVGAGVAIGSRVQAIASNTSLTLTRKATATGTVTLTFGSAAISLDGEGARDIYVPEVPLTSLIGAYEVDDDGVRQALDITGARIERETGRVVLSYDSFPKGSLNISIDCIAGYIEPSASALGDFGAWSALRGIHMRVAEVFFTDAASLRGRQTDVTIGSGSARLPDFAMPADIEGAIHPFIRRWA